MRCYVCDKVGDWHRPTIKKNGKEVPIHSEMITQICRNCGSACHDVDVSKEAEIKEYYRKSYRPQPSLVNLITTTHKQNYVQVFMRDFLKANRERHMIVGDVGAATGYLCNFFKLLGHKPTGCELTLTYRRMSEHYYGIPLSEELEPKHKYDLIVVYHVLEHLMNPDKKLAHYVSLLADGGHMLIAVPEWFDFIDEAAGIPIQSFDNLFHKNHINLFSRTSVRNLFRKCGLEVVKEDLVQYGQTYLLRKRDSPVIDGWLTKEDYNEISRIMINQKTAIDDLFILGKYREAFELYPRFPEAWLNYIFNKNLKDMAKQTDLFAEASKVIGDSLRFVLARGQWHYQYGRMAEAIEDMRKVCDVKPNEDTFMFLGYAYAQLGMPNEAMHSMNQAQAMDPRKWQEANTWILNQVANMPTWDERALIEAQGALTLRPADNASKLQPSAS